MKTASVFSVTFFLNCLIASATLVSATNVSKTNGPCQYFIYVNYLKDVNRETFDSNILAEVLGNMEVAKKAPTYHYDTVKSGFIASLTPDQVESIKKNPRIFRVVEAKGDIQTQLETKDSYDNAVLDL